MKVYFGAKGWGWVMYGFGYKAKWFFGFSINNSWQEQAKLMAAAGISKIEIIKMIRNRTGMMLRDCKEASESFGHDWEINSKSLLKRVDAQRWRKE